MIETGKFRTLTEVRERNNGGAETAWPVAIDVGYSGVKVMSPSAVACFPSYAARIQEEYGVIGEMPDSYIVYTDLQSGEKWVVGQSAQDNIHDRDTSVSERALYGRDRYGDPAFRVIVRTGLAIGMSAGKFGSPDGKRVVIQTGYPPRYEEDTEDLVEAMEGEHEYAVKIGSHKEQKYHFTLSREDIYAMKQPLGTLFSVTIDRDGNDVQSMRDLLRKNVIVFDAGFGTLDLFPVRAGHLGESETDDKLGMYRVLQETSSELKRKHGIYANVPAMQKYLKTGMARYYRKNVSKDIPFGNILEAASERVCLEAVAKMQSSFHLDEFDYLIITGGTGDAWKSIIRRELAQMSTLKILDGNCSDVLPFVYANVRGYYLYRLKKCRQEEASARSRKGGAS